MSNHEDVETGEVTDPMAEPDEQQGLNGNGTVDSSLDDRELTAIIEALLFVSHEPLTVERLAGVISESSTATIVKALRELQSTCEREQRGVQLVEIAGGWQTVTRPEHGSWIRRLDKSKAAPKLSRSALETLAIIAYKQPIVRAEIEHIRGVETSGVLRTLLERKLVRIVGRKDVPGRPIMYGSTKFFLQHFGLKDLAELPPLREFKELGEAEQASLLADTSEMISGEAGDSIDPRSADAEGNESGEAELSNADPLAVYTSSHIPGPA